MQENGYGGCVSLRKKEFTLKKLYKMAKTNDRFWKEDANNYLALRNVQFLSQVTIRCLP